LLRDSGCRWGFLIKIWLLLCIVLIGTVAANAYEDAMPISGSTPYKEISAKVLQEEATIRPIDYDHVIVIGDLNLDGAECKSIDIINSIFRGNASFLSATFSGHINFSDTTFQKKAEFNWSRFEGEVDFNNSHFFEPVSFSDSTFLELASFEYITFDKVADFSADYFSKSASFYNSTFAEDAFFYLSQFNGVYANFDLIRFMKEIDFDSCRCNAFLSFSDSEIKEYADFHGCRFAGGVILLNSTFLGESNFARCHFSEDSRFQAMSLNNTVDFDSAKFDGPLFFNGTAFGGDAIFDGTQFLGPADLSNTQFVGNLALNSTKISTMVLDNAAFQPKSQLFLGKADISRFMVKWSEIEDLLAYDTSAYLSLVKNYRDMGTGDADDCYYQFRRVTQDRRDWGWARILDILANITCGYGVRADRPVYCSIVLIAICCAILWAGKGLRKPSEQEKNTCLFDSLYYCLAIFFTIPLPDLKPVGNFKYVPVFLRAISWTLFALMIATLSKVMIK
jgi:hypothetical protein